MDINQLILLVENKLSNNILAQNIFGIIALPEEIYFISYLPMLISLKDILAILFISFVMVFISINIATRRTLMLSPLQSINLEK